VIVSGKTRLCAVIGDPVKHSLSPCIHNAAFQHLKLDYVYVAFEVARGDIEAAVQGIKSLGIYGINVTMPHKVGIIKHLDELNESAKTVGAVNTILNKEGKLIGYNTDGEGALKALTAEHQNPTGKKVVILGAGGASRSVSHSLAPLAREMMILNQTVDFEKAEDLAKELTAKFGSKIRYGKLSEGNLKRELENADLFVNATPLGMHPNENETPVNHGLLHPDIAIFDLVYYPNETRLLREAKAVGAPTIEGLSMLVHQGAVSFEIWTGKKPPVDVMMKAAREQLKQPREAR
jgi:shikimate dehydrogenase